MIRISPSVQAVVFDIDDTLYGERQYIRSGYAAAAGYLRHRLHTADRYEDWLWNRFLTDKAAGAFDSLNDRFHLGLDSAAIAELVQVYRDHRPNIAPYEGMPELLECLKARHRLGVLSDGFLPAQRLKLQALGLEGFFDAVVYTESLGRQAWKPSPEGFELIAAKLALPHVAMAYVGDNPVKDFIAPNRLGWSTIQLVMDGQVHKQPPPVDNAHPQIVVRSLAELRDVLAT